MATVWQRRPAEAAVTVNSPGRADLLAAATHFLAVLIVAQAFASPVSSNTHYLTILGGWLLVARDTTARKSPGLHHRLTCPCAPRSTSKIR